MGRLVGFLEPVVPTMSGTGGGTESNNSGGESLRPVVERRRRLMTITASARRRPRLGSAVLLSAESIKTGLKEHSSYRDEALRHVHDLCGEEARRPVLYRESCPLARLP